MSTNKKPFGIHMRTLEEQKKNPLPVSASMGGKMVKNGKIYGSDVPKTTSTTPFSEIDLVDIYKRNEFLIKDDNQEIWFNIEDSVDTKYFEVPFVIITAWNPMNSNKSIDDNVITNKRLEDKIKSLKYFYEPTVGRCDGHSEDSFIIYHMPIHIALDIGLEFNQYSIFHNGLRHMEYLKCADKSVILKSKKRKNATVTSYVPNYHTINEDASVQELTSFLKESSIVCPMPGHWDKVWRMLEDKSIDIPLILSAWGSPEDYKQERFFQHLLYASEHNLLPKVIRYLNRLEEDAWCMKV